MAARVSRQELKALGASKRELDKAAKYGVETAGRVWYQKSDLVANLDEWSVRRRRDFWRQILVEQQVEVTSIGALRYNVLSGEFVSDESGITPSSAGELKTLIEAHGVHRRTLRDDARADADMIGRQRDTETWRDTLMSEIIQVLEKPLDVLEAQVRAKLMNGRDHSRLASEVAALEPAQRQRRIETWTMRQTNDVLDSVEAYVNDEFVGALREAIDERLQRPPK